MDYTRGFPDRYQWIANSLGLIITTAGLGEDISGVIPYDATIRQQK